jgi:hypothetical protein
VNDVPWFAKDTRSLTKYAESLKGYVCIIRVEARQQRHRATTLEVYLGGHTAPGYWTRDAILKQVASLMARHTTWEQRIGCFIHLDGRSCSIDLIWEDPCKS